MKRFYRVPAFYHEEYDEYAPKYLYDENGWAIRVDNRVLNGTYDVEWITTAQKHLEFKLHSDVQEIDKPGGNPILISTSPNAEEEGTEPSETTETA